MNNKKEIEIRKILKSALENKYPNMEFEVLNALTKDGKFRKVKINKMKFSHTIEELGKYSVRVNSFNPKENWANLNPTYQILDTTSLSLDDFIFDKSEQFKKNAGRDKMWIWNNILLTRNFSSDYITSDRKCNTYKLLNIQTGELSPEFSAIRLDYGAYFGSDACTDNILLPIQIGKDIYIIDAQEIEILPIKFNEVPKGLSYNSNEQDRMALYCQILKQRPELLPRLYVNIRNFNNPNNYISLINAIMDGLIDNHLEDEKYCNNIIKMIKQETKNIAKENKNKDINTETKKVIDAFKSR